MEKNILKTIKVSLLFITLLIINGCSNTSPLPTATLHPSDTTDISSYKYLIGPGDNLKIFVWRNPEVSGTFKVRPDGMITTSLVEDIPVSGKTPTQVAREFEKILSTYLRDPIVTVTVSKFVGPFSEQIRIVGEAAKPKSINYTQNMTLLDVMIEVGGLTQYANGNKAVLVRIEDGKQVQYPVYIDDLLKNGEISENVDVLPGDIIIIPETWF